MKKILFFLVSLNLRVIPVSLQKIIDSNLLSVNKNGELDLSNLKLSNISGIEAFSNIQNIQYLNLSNNKLRSICELAKIKTCRLKVIDLSFNRLRCVKVLIKFKDLEVIYLDDNLIGIEDLQYVVNNLKKLKKIFINNNPIKCRMYEFNASSII